MSSSEGEIDTELSRKVVHSKACASLFAVVLINSTTMQAMAKIVYYGPGLCGKTPTSSTSIGGSFLTKLPP